MSLARNLSKLAQFLNGSGLLTSLGLAPDAVQVGMKNRIINGAMMIDQRNAGAAKTLTAGVQAYVLDRFYVATNGGAGIVQQVAGTGGFTKAMRITGAAGVTDGYFGQKIESYNIADAASSTVTYKIRASSSVLTSLTWYARFPTAQDNYAGVTLITSGSITINSTPTDYTFQIALPSGVTNGLEVYFTFGAFTSGTLDITGVQLEKNSTATSFDYRPYSTELALCQRYYWRWTSTNNSYLYLTTAGRSYSTTNGTVAIQHPVPMRTFPSMNNSNNFAAGNWDYSLSAIAINNGGYAAFPYNITNLNITGAFAGADRSFALGSGSSTSTTIWIEFPAEL